jgi:hypothetical protein
MSDETRRKLIALLRAAADELEAELGAGVLHLADDNDAATGLRAQLAIVQARGDAA